jgi:hypothetical protein
MSLIIGKNHTHKNNKADIMPHKRVIALVLLPFLYLFSSVIAFDFSESVDMGEAGFCNGSEISAGPSPRLWARFICPPGDYDFPAGGTYTGDEWLFKFYAPICESWRERHDYIAPSDCPN